MAERPIGRNVISRDRFSRLISLGDRNNPSSWSPCLILGEEDPEVPISIAPLVSKSDTSAIPSSTKIRTRSKLCFPFESEEEESWSFGNGLALPPSLVDSNSGEFGFGKEVIPVTWNSLHNDSSLLELEYQPSIIVLMDAPQLANNRGMLERAILTIRTSFPSSLIWAAGISGPDNCALLSWMGVDIFDMARSRQANSLGVLLTENGPRLPEPSTGEDLDMDLQAKLWINAISATRSAIRDGSLRELAERQSTSSPRSVEHLRIHDQISYQITDRIGITDSCVEVGKILRCHSFESRNDATIRLWRDNISQKYVPPPHQKEILILLPCSAKKPYKLSPSHASFRKQIGDIRAHEIMVTAPLGLVPRELEDLWPAAHYDIPVTGDWDADELVMIYDMLDQLIDRVGYSTVINHSGLDYKSKITNVINTRVRESARSKDALARLSREVKSACTGLNDVPAELSHRIEKLKSISRFIHGFDDWLNGCQVRGRPPILTIIKNGDQMAKWDPRRGRFLMSKACIRSMHDNDSLKVVELLDEVDWVGDIFPNMVKRNDSNILVGDEIRVIQTGKLLGSARVLAPGWEWPHGPGKLAKSRHRI